VGRELDIAKLAGQWVGDYSSVQTGRSGSIVFRLVAATDSAYGDVLMDPSVGWGARPGNAATPSPGGAAPVMSPPIAISVVRVSGNQVSGRLAPYTDPDCHCPLFTTFEGTLRADTLAGTYTSRHETGGSIQSGRWTVVRKAP
jgi:hypothetical protein